MTEHTAFEDVETLDALRGHPELLAIADALAATHARRRRRPLVRLGLVAAVVAVAAAVALVAPWQGRGGGFTARALAALGDGQVIHVVSISDVPGQSVLDLATGSEQPVETRTEIWFDDRRGLERTVLSTGGRVLSEELQTPEGAWTQDGRVYSCAWIAAHPVEATKARVSCSASGDNGTTPREIPEPRPSLDPALAGFVGGYRDALATGTAQRDGAGTVDGRPVEWLRFRSERVAVDTATLRPVLVETLADGRAVVQARIATIETLDPSGVDFSRPQQGPPGQEPTVTNVTSQETVSLADAKAALGGRLVWAGQTLANLPVGDPTVQEIATGYGDDSGLPVSHSTGVEVAYGDATALPLSGSDYVLLREATEPQMLYGFAGPGRVLPAAGGMLVSGTQVLTSAPGTTQAVPTGRTIWRGLLASDGLYVAIETSSKPLLLEAARALRPYGGSS